MKYPDCYGKFTKKHCPHFHPSNMYDAIHEQMGSYAQQRCWCMKDNLPVREVYMTCKNTETYSFNIYITGKLELHNADSLNDVVEYINTFFPRRGITVENVNCSFKNQDQPTTKEASE